MCDSNRLNRERIASIHDGPITANELQRMGSNASYRHNLAGHAKRNSKRVTDSGGNRKSTCSSQA